MPIDLWLPPKPAIIRPAPKIKNASFLPGMFPAAAAAAVGANAIDVSYVTTLVSTTPGATHTFTAASIGAAAADRQVIVGVTAIDSAAPRTFSSVTIGGVAATIHGQIQESAGDFSSGALVSRVVTAGTTATIVVNLNASGDECFIHIYRKVGGSGTTPHNIQSADSGGTASASVSLSVPEGGSVVAASGGFYAGLATWVGATKDADVSGNYQSSTAAHQNGLSVEASRTVSRDSLTYNEGVIIAGSWV